MFQTFQSTQSHGEMSYSDFPTITELPDGNLFQDIDFPDEETEVLEETSGIRLPAVPGEELTDKGPNFLFNPQVDEEQILYDTTDIDQSTPFASGVNDIAGSSFLQYDNDDILTGDQALKGLFVDDELFNPSFYNINLENAHDDERFFDPQPFGEYSFLVSSPCHYRS